MEKYIMSFDQGTTSSRCIIYNKNGKVISSAQKEFKQIYPKAGWVEHDPMEIWSTQIGVAQEALYKINGTYENIMAIGITNQRETTVVWNRHTGEPVYNAIVWQCRRTAEYCEELKNKGLSDMIKKKTGLLIDPYFSGTKLKWILENVDGARESAENGDLMFGTIETWLIWKLTMGKTFITDYSNASRTMMFNINELRWDDEILQELNIPKGMLAQVMESSKVYGQTNPAIFGGPVIISGAAGDQQAALFGQTCFTKGEAKGTYGTGCFLLMNTGEAPVYSDNGLLTTIGWGINGKIHYALEGSVFIAGASVQWLRDEMKIIDSSVDSEWMANKVKDSDGVYIVPAFVGLGAPYWNPYARGTIVGISRGTNRNHIVRATLEAIAYQAADLLHLMEEESGIKLASLKVDGGASTNNFLMQFQADILGIEVKRPESIETTSLGAAYLAGLAVGYWKDEADIIENWQLGKDFIVEMDESKREVLIKGWRRAVRC
ncbi:MAG TPA: glycerol kinase GlpK, partial [Anaerovoracaceae bacterium]|nr:glycerol kinase GlpK [Anaerovoracaceae bacterium]